MPFQLAKAHDVEVAIGFMSFEEVCEFSPFPSNKQKQFGVILFERYNPLLPQRLPGAPNSGTWDGSLKTKDHWAWSWTFCCHCSILKDMNSHSLQLLYTQDCKIFQFFFLARLSQILAFWKMFSFQHKGLRTPPQVVILRGLGTIDLDPYEGQELTWPLHTRLADWPIGIPRISFDNNTLPVIPSAEAPLEKSSRHWNS